VTYRLRHVYTAVEAEALFGISASTIRSWVRREKLFPAGRAENMAAMYDRDHLLALRDARKPKEAAA
jgi:DNA-binding transcriptional MerR regulator